MAVASAEPYASLHLAPDRYQRQHPTTQFFTGRMPFLPPNQQRLSTEGGLMMHVSLLCLCVKVASIDGLMPFLVACHCAIFIVNLLFCYVLGKSISLSTKRQTTPDLLWTCCIVLLMSVTCSTCRCCGFVVTCRFVVQLSVPTNSQQVEVMGFGPNGVRSPQTYETVAEYRVCFICVVRDCHIYCSHSSFANVPRPYCDFTFKTSFYDLQ